MKKFVTAALLCLLLLTCACASAEGVELDITVDIPTSVDMNSTLPLTLVYEDPDLMPTGVLTVTPANGIKVNNIYLAYGSETFGGAQNPMTLGGKQYYYWSGYDPEPGMDISLFIMIDVPKGASSVTKVRVNNKECQFVFAPDETTDDYYVLYPVGAVAENGELIFAEETPKTGDNTPVMLLGGLFLLGAAGVVVFVKRRRA